MGNCFLAFIVVWRWKQGAEGPQQGSFGSDYWLNKREARGKMVMGFEKANHIHTLHNREEQGFVRL
jgi:hypothetical protein